MIDLGDGEVVPTLEDVIKLFEFSPKILLNIEIKGPMTRKWAEMYDSEAAASALLISVNQNRIGPKTIISSFSPDILKKILWFAPRKEQREYSILLLCNRSSTASCFNNYVTP